ncbi:MAG: hypothetical protein E6R04_00450 [Spirochaetes bacterium]|nr:MAG: hypothetical protein E6R04_00450 [Spirochaetota bacterium]
MDTTHSVTWFAGLFEGEGCFNFSNGKPKRMTISMTDRDVLDHVQSLFGGTVVSLKKREEHHKDVWIWYLHGESSVELAKKIQPYLFSRRAKRCAEYIEKFSTMSDRRNKAASLRESVRSLRNEGYKHREIAERLEIDRTYVSHILRGRHDTKSSVVMQAGEAG